MFVIIVLAQGDVTYDYEIFPNRAISKRWLLIVFLAQGEEDTKITKSFPSEQFPIDYLLIFLKIFFLAHGEEKTYYYDFPIKQFPND